MELPISIGSMGAAVISGDDDEFESSREAPIRPPMIPPPKAIDNTKATAAIRAPRGRDDFTCGGVLIQWESELMN